VPPIFGALEANAAHNPHLADVQTNLFQVAVGSEPKTSGVKLSYFRTIPTDSTTTLAGKRRDFECFFAHHGNEIRKKLAPFISDRIARVIGTVVARLPTGAIGRWLSDCFTGRVEFECAMTTLSAVVDQHDVSRIDLLKVDVEGAELDVLRGIDDEHWPLIQQVVLEGHDQNGELDAIKNILDRQGFDIVRLGHPKGAAERGLTSFLIYARR
jgi:hypothetical protein